MVFLCYQLEMIKKNWFLGQFKFFFLDSGEKKKLVRKPNLKYFDQMYINKISIVNF